MAQPETLPVWFYWDGPCPAWIERCQATIVRHAANPRQLDWPTFDALWDLDREIDLSELYVAHQADFIRAFLLARHGGLWIDSDCIVMRQLDEILALVEKHDFVAHRERQGQFSNGFIGARPGSELARQYYQRVRDTLRSGAPRHWTSLGSEPLGAVLSSAPRGLHELDCHNIQPICWSRPAEFFAIRTADEHDLHVDVNAFTYMLSNNTVQSYVRDHPGASLMTEGSFFRHLLICSGAGTSADEGGARRTIWEQLHSKALGGTGESLSGPGSALEQTRVVRARLGALLRRIGAATLLDAPCGDHHWMSRVELPADYVGIDILPDLIARNQSRHTERQFRLADLITDDLPRADLILCRDALVHYSFVMAFAILRNFRRSGARWMLTTTFPGHDNNHDIAVGDWRPLNLELPPFNFPPPKELIVERCSEGEGRYRDKSLGLWCFDDLPLDQSECAMVEVTSGCDS